jgi:pilus assembly protein FimV
MNRTEGHWIPRALALLMLLAPVGASALGLGEARVESFLNQQLDVRMRLLDVTAEELDSLTVAPASPRDFERLGLTSGALSLNLRAEVDDSVDPPVVRVSSVRPVNDPVIQLAIDARWAGGRVLREYTLFLDPPTVEIAPPPPAPEPEPAPRSAAVERPAPESGVPDAGATGSEPSEPAPRAMAGDGRYGPVASGETLWSIAQRNLPADGVTMDQMMIAIVELNPSAFRGGNINRLLRGAELDIPDAERARLLDAAAAAAAVAAQNRAFNRGADAGDDPPRVSDAGRDALPEQQPEDPAAASADASSDAEEPRLSLVPPGENEAGGADGDGDSVDALRQRLARAEEELFAARQEAEEFQNRVEELEQIVRGNPTGVGIRDADLAGLQETLRAARQATREDADSEARADVSARLDDYIERLSAAPDATATDDAGAGAPADAAAASANEPETAPGAAAEEPGGDQSPSDADDGRDGGLPRWAPFAVAALAILALVVFGVRMLQRRRNEQSDSGTARAAPEAASESAAPQDPLDRARAHLTESPDDLDRHVELLEQLAAENRESEFSDALEAMFEHVDTGSEPQWRRALTLAGRIAPGHVLVKGSADWVADDAGERRDPGSALDEDAEVDDLMARLEADEAEASEPAESEWPDFDEREEKTEGGLAADTDAADTDADESFDFESVRPTEGRSPEPAPESADDDEPEGLAFDLPDDDADSRPEASDADAGDAEPDYGSPTLEWPQFGEYAGDEALAGEAGDDAPGGEGTGEGEGSDADEGETGAAEADEIFGQSDDDIDVKLDLARAYLSWDSADSARTLLEEVMREGNDAQREQARKLLDDPGGDSES